MRAAQSVIKRPLLTEKSARLRETGSMLPADVFTRELSEA